jgi:hypothetical protein
MMVDEAPTKALAARLRQAIHASSKNQTELAALFEISDGFCWRLYGDGPYSGFGRW